MKKKIRGINLQAVIHAYKCMSPSQKEEFMKSTGLVELPAPPASPPTPTTPIPKKKCNGNRSDTNLLCNLAKTDVAKLKRSKCMFCHGSIALTHTTAKCRNYTVNGQNKHAIKAMEKHLAKENAKIKRAYTNLGAAALYDEEVNYALENILTWEEIFFATCDLEDRGLVNGVDYDRVILR